MIKTVNKNNNKYKNGLNQQNLCMHVGNREIMKMYDKDRY